MVVQPRLVKMTEREDRKLILPCKFGQTHMKVMFTVLNFGQTRIVTLQSYSNVNSPRSFLVILQGHFGSSLSVMLTILVQPPTIFCIIIFY